MNRIREKSLKYRMISCLLLLALLMLPACGKKTSEAPELLEPVSKQHDTVTVTRGDYTTISVRDAFVVPEVLRLEAEIPGTVLEIPFVSGDYVEEGALVLKLDAQEEEEKIAEIREVMAVQETLNSYEDRIYEIDKATLEKEKVLYYQQGAGWQSQELKNLELQELELQREETLRKREQQQKDWDEELSKLQKTVDQSSLYAPRSGRIYYPGTAGDKLQALVAEGEPVTAHTTLAFIIDETSLHIEMDGDMTQSDQKLSYYSLIENRPVPVEYVPLSAEEEAKNRLLSTLPKTVFELKETVPDLSAGMYTPIVFETAVYEDVLLVPASAVMRDPDLKKDYVLVLNAQGEKERRDVEVRSDGIQAVILQGLSEGEVLYVYE